MTDLFQQDFYKNFKKMLLIRLCITIGFPLFYSIKAFIIDTYSIDKSFLTGYIIFSNIVVACGLIGCFIYASNRKNSYISGNIKTRFENNKSDIELSTFKRIIESGLGKRLTMQIK